MIEKSYQTIMKILENPTESELKEIKHVFDNGFFTLDNLEEIAKELYDVYMPTTEQARKFKNLITQKEVGTYSIDNFKYEPVFDFFICPEKQILHHTNNTVTNGIPKKCYTGAPCSKCPARQKCCNGKHRQIQKTDNKLLKELEKKMETKEAATIYKLRKRIENAFAYLKGVLKHLQYQTIGIEKANKELTQEVLARNLIMIFNLDQQQKEKV